MPPRISHPVPSKGDSGDLIESMKRATSIPRSGSPLARSASGPNLVASSSHSLKNEIYLNQFKTRCMTPGASLNEGDFTSVETKRATHYNLNYPEDEAVATNLLYDVSSPLFARLEPRNLDLISLLPYQTERVCDQAQYLSHIVSHIYIAIKSLDLQGALHVSAKQLTSAQNGLINDVDLALDTDLIDIDIPMDENDSGDDSDGVDFGDDMDLLGGTSTPVHKISPRSAAIVSLKHWAVELKTFIKMKFVMPVTLRVALAKVFFAICLSRGQPINLDLYIELFHLLTKDKELLKENGLKLEWRLVFAEIESNFPQPDFNYDSYDKAHYKKLIDLAFQASHFFDENSVPEIMERLLNKFSLQTASLALSALYCMVPITFKEKTSSGFHETDIRHYIPSLFHIWSAVKKSGSVSNNIVALLGRIAEKSLLELTRQKHSAPSGEYGVFSKDQFKEILTQFFSSLKVVNRLSADAEPSTSYYQSFATIIVCSMHGDGALVEEGVIDQLSNLANGIRTYVHPSNTGPWSSAISKAVHVLIYTFHHRLILETGRNQTNSHWLSLRSLPQDSRLSPATVQFFRDIMFPIVNMGVQSKNDGSVNSFVRSLNLLTFIDKRFVIDRCLLDVYSSLLNVTSTHRLNVVLKQLTVLTRYLCEIPYYRVHLVRILSMLLEGIDSNDLGKTHQTLYFFSTVASFVPIAEIGSNNDGGALALDFTSRHLELLESQFFSGEGELRIDEIISQEDELSAFHSATSAFYEFTVIFCERLTRLLENLPENPGRMETKVIEIIPKTMSIILESCSDDIFHCLAEKVYHFVEGNVHHTVADTVGAVVSILIKRNPESQFPRVFNSLVPRIREEIEENGAASTRSGIDIAPRDQALFWYMSILSAALATAGREVLKVKDRLSEFTTFIMERVKGPVSLISPLMLQNTLLTTTTTRMVESRLISKDWLSNNNGELNETCWGGFQFDNSRFSNLEFEWFIPSEEDVEFAVNCFVSHTRKCLLDMSGLMKTAEEANQSSQTQLDFSDSFASSLIYLSSGLSGICHLFDPSYKNAPAKERFKPQSLEQKLSLIKNLRLYKDSVGGKTDEEEISELVEQLMGNGTNSTRDSTPEPESDKDDTSVGVSTDSDDPFSSDAVLDDDQIDNINEVPISDKMTPSPSVSVSRAGTPMEGDMRHDGFGVCDPSLTLRDQGIYACNYYFSDRKSSDLYFKLHKVRRLVGKFLLHVCKFLASKWENDVHLFKVLLHTVKVFLCNVGADFFSNQLEESLLDYEYLSGIQYLSKVHKPYTRITMGARIEKYHKQRVAIFGGNRVVADLDRKLLEQVVSLCGSPYADIAKAAQAALTSSMRKLLGSFSVLVSMLDVLEFAIVASDVKRITSCLRLFSHKKIKTRFMNHLSSIQRYSSLLARCMMVDDVEVNSLASDLYDEVAHNFSFPSAICLIHWDYIEAIKPPDKHIDAEIEALKQAKEKTREGMLQQVKNFERELLSSSHSHWKIRALSLGIIIAIQSDMDTVIEPEAFVTIASAVSDGSSVHPLISKTCLKGVHSLFSKIANLGAFEYNLENAYSLSFLSDELEFVNTKPAETCLNYRDVFLREMANFDKPAYFFDNKISFSWLYWTDTMKVVRAGNFVDVGLKEPEILLLKQFGKVLNKKWLLDLMTLLTQDTESEQTFQGIHVLFIGTIAHMISLKCCSDLTYKDVLEVIDEIYDAEEKSNHIVVCEIICGLLVASKQTDPKYITLRDEFLVNKLHDVVSRDLSPETRAVWNIFSWWLPSHVDCRRFPRVMDQITKFRPEKGSDNAVKDSTRLGMLRLFIGNTNWRFYGFEPLIDYCFQNVAHPYQSMREQIASLICVLYVGYPHNSKASFQDFVECNNQSEGTVGCAPYAIPAFFHTHFVSLFESVELLRIETEGMDIHEILKSEYFCAARTILSLLKQLAISNASIGLVPYLRKYVVPFLFRLESMRNVTKQANISPMLIYVLMAQIPFRLDEMQGVIDMTVGLNDLESPSWHDVVSILGFAQGFYFLKSLSLTSAQHTTMLSFFKGLLFSANLEVRQAAAKSLSGIIHIFPKRRAENVIPQLIEEFSKVVTQPEVSLTTLHGATLGLGALVDAFPYQSPPPYWIPQVLSILSRKVSGRKGVVGKTAKEILSNFKKTRQDTWHIDSKFFSSDELDDLEGVLWKSYFI